MGRKGSREQATMAIGRSEGMRGGRDAGHRGKGGGGNTKMKDRQGERTNLAVLASKRVLGCETREGRNEGRGRAGEGNRAERARANGAQTLVVSSLGEER
eukprot:scaffold205032_cov33-Tisochrysis_lutea.AAC.4